MTNTITRHEAVNALRRAYARRLDEEMSMCRFAAEHGVFCRGFRRLHDDDLRRRLLWISSKDPSMTPAEMEEVAERWQLARQDVLGAPLACDVQSVEHDLCGGWDDFTDDELARFYFEAFRKKVVVT